MIWIILFLGVFVLWIGALTVRFVLCVIYELLRALVLLAFPSLRPEYMIGSTRKSASPPKKRVEPTFDGKIVLSEDDHIVIPFRRRKSP